MRPGTCRPPLHRCRKYRNPCSGPGWPGMITCTLHSRKLATKLADPFNFCSHGCPRCMPRNDRYPLQHLQTGIRRSHSTLLFSVLVIPCCSWQDHSCPVTCSRTSRWDKCMGVRAPSRALPRTLQRRRRSRRRSACLAVITEQCAAGGDCIHLRFALCEPLKAAHSAHHTGMPLHLGSSSARMQGSIWLRALHNTLFYKREES